MFFTVVEKTTEVRDALTDNYRRLARIVDGTAGGIATVATIYEAIKTWLMIIDAHDAAWATVQGITGLMAGYLGGLHGMKKHELTNAAYNHPGV